MKETRKFGKAVWQITGNKDVDLVFEHPGEATFPVSVSWSSAAHGAICAGTSGYNLTMDARFLWMRQKRVQGSHFANLMQAARPTSWSSTAGRSLPVGGLPLGGHPPGPREDAR